MWKKIFLTQICVCLLIVSGYIAIERSNYELLKERRSEVIAAVSRHYIVSDIWNKGKNAVFSLIKMPVAVTDYVISAQENQQYAQPIAPVSDGGITSIYAVAGGQVISTGENKKIGKYIKIQHEDAISIYGNCTRVYVKEGKHVKRGQVIGRFLKEADNEFYYNLIEE